LEAIRAAGGLAPGADPAQLNLAALVPDGAQIIVGTASQPFGELRTAPAAPSAAAITGDSGQPAAQLNLNTATAEQLDGLPGVGPVTAQHILDWRTAHGPFTRVEELQEVDGIGPKTYAEIAPHVRV
jgi:competence protein ComEA